VPSVAGWLNQIYRCAGGIRPPRPPMRPGGALWRCATQTPVSDPSISAAVECRTAGLTWEEGVEVCNMTTAADIVCGMVCNRRQSSGPQTGEANPCVCHETCV
jgi:hypothetical protein